MKWPQSGLRIASLDLWSLFQYLRLIWDFEAIEAVQNGLKTALIWPQSLKNYGWAWGNSYLLTLKNQNSVDNQPNPSKISMMVK